MVVKWVSVHSSIYPKYFWDKLLHTYFLECFCHTTAKWKPSSLKTTLILQMNEQDQFCLVAKSWLALLWPHGLEPTRLLCPWNFPGNNTGGGCISFSRGSSWPREGTHISCIDRQILYHWATREAQRGLKRPFNKDHQLSNLNTLLFILSVILTASLSYNSHTIQLT